MALNQSLDDMISSQQRPWRGGRGRGGGRGFRGRGGRGAFAVRPRVVGAGMGGGARWGRGGGLAVARAAPYQVRRDPDMDGEWVHDMAEQVEDFGPRRVLVGGGGMGGVGGGGGNPSALLVGGISYEWDENDLEEIFADFGEVTNVEIEWDDSGRSTGNALITYGTRREALSAMQELDGTEIGDCVISVTNADRRSFASVGGGGGAGRGWGPPRGRGRGRGGFFGMRGGRFGRGRGFGGRGRGFGGRGRGRGRDAPVDADQLDMQLDSYNQGA